MKVILEYEDLIFKLIQEYVSKNRIFNSEDILPYLMSRVAKSKINLNQKGIMLIIQSLIKKNKIIEGSTLTRSDVLENINRDTVYDYIMRNPGSYFRKMVRDLKCSKSVIAWHVKILLDFEYIKSKNIDNRDIYYDINLDPEVALFFYLNSNEKCKKIVDFFNERDQISKLSEIYNSVGMHHYTIKKYMDLLEEIKILTKENKNDSFCITFNRRKYIKLSNSLKL